MICGRPGGLRGRFVTELKKNKKKTNGGAKTFAERRWYPDTGFDGGGGLHVGAGHHCSYVVMGPGGEGDPPLHVPSKSRAGGSPSQLIGSESATSNSRS